MVTAISRLRLQSPGKVRKPGILAKTVRLRSQSGGFDQTCGIVITIPALPIKSQECDRNRGNGDHNGGIVM